MTDEKKTRAVEGSRVVEGLRERERTRDRERDILPRR